MKKNKKFLLMGLMLLVLAGCSNYLGPDGKVMESKIITWGDSWIWGTEGASWFDALFVWPIAQALNFLTPYVGAFLSIVIVSVAMKMELLANHDNPIKWFIIRRYFFDHVSYLSFSFVSKYSISHFF